MNDETLAREELRNGASASDAAPAQQAAAFGAVQPRSESMQTIVVAATFTADLLQQPLSFWMETLEIAADITLAPYAQVMQELLNPGSLLSTNTRGFNVLLIRLQDWIRDKPAEGVEANLQHSRRACKEFAAAVATLRARSSAPLFIVFCPYSSSLPAVYREQLDEIQLELFNRLIVLANTHCWTHADLARLYPTTDHEDPRADRIGHIPYTREYFVALGTLLARRIAVLLKPQCKVMAIDCDNTLWRGICGEDGPKGVELTPAHLEFQRALVRQHDAGVLLCLCSKNNPADVDAVFEAHPHMPLRKEHLVCSRVSWNSKSENLRALADELGLALESFILIDDSPLECAEVRENCSAVLTLQFPSTAAGISHFLDHVWAFDRVGVTEEAKQRTAQYMQNRVRNKAREQATDLQQFLASLELKVDIAPMDCVHLARVAELVQRTNQFNLTGVRRRASEIEALVKAGDLEVLVVHVRDRFGDYGLVGAVFFRCEALSIDVDTFVLSCRVLGRGVEHRIVEQLGRLARQRQRTQVVLRYRSSARNSPARTFLETSFSRFGEPSSSANESAAESIFAIPVEYAEAASGEHSIGWAAKKDNDPVAAANGTQGRTSANWHETAYRLSRPSDVITEMTRALSSTRARQREYVPPRTPREAAVAGIWADVLGVGEIGVHDDFLELGGDSLLAVQAIACIGSVLGLELSIYDFFEEPTVEAVASKLAAAASSGAMIERTDRTGPVAMSSAQQRLWFIDRLEGSSAAYHIHLAVRLQGPIDRNALQAALDALISRHEALRTIFVEIGGTPIQRIISPTAFALVQTDLSSQDGLKREASVLSQSLEELAAPFDLSTGPLVRGRLLRLSKDEHVLLITMHHIASDGWSIGVLIRELGAMYETFRNGQPDPLPALPIQYADYAQWQQRWLTSTHLQEQLAYWNEHLRGAPELLDLPLDRPRPPAQTYRGASVAVSLDRELTENLKGMARRLNVTLAMTLHAAWCIVLSRLSGQEDIVVGIPVANRRRTELEGLIGLFVNTIAVRVRLGGDEQIADLLRRVKKIMLDAQTHQDVPFEHVVEVLQPARSLSHSPIFQTMFALQSAPRSLLQLHGLKVVEQEIPTITTQFDLLLSLQDSTSGIFGSLSYATDLFDSETVKRWVGYFETVLTAMSSDPQSIVSSLTLMDEHERRQLVEHFNATAAPYEREKLIHQLFEEQVARTPNAVAVTYEEQSLTYAQLNAKANQLARHLRGKGVVADQLVGICVERSLEMVVGLCGILKAGGAYVPLDPDYPPERLEYMLEDAAPRVLLTQTRLRKRLPASAQVEVIQLDGEDWSEIARNASDDLNADTVGTRPHHLAYVIYTSGSTGKPKGAMNEHRALINRLQWMQKQYLLGERDCVLQKTPFSFDVSVWEFFWTLLSGAQLAVARPRGHQDPDYLRRLIERERVTTLHFVPSMLQIFVDQLQAGQCARLRHIVCSGEELPASLQRKVFECLPQVQLSNLYGPTEAAIDVTYWECRPEDKSARVPIGRPISNVKMYVLDVYHQPVPLGVAGEIYIGGVGVGRGYLNRTELTAERFVRDPFDSNQQARMYKTGDLGRWRTDGAIEYLGRNDHQVKIRGFRIELGEIEAQLARHALVKDAAVLARQDTPGEKRLVAYLVPDGATDPLSVEELRAYLKIALPEYMIPSAFVMLERMPLSPNGKLDRRALPAPQLDAYTSRRYEEPQGELEEMLAGIWQSLLRVERVGRQDNFFELGGHSLLIVQMMERLRRVGLSTELRRVFESPTLADLAAVVANEAAEHFEVPPNLIPTPCAAIAPAMLSLVELQAQSIERIVQAVPGGVANVKDIYPLAPLQEGILFHHLLNEQGGDTYVLPTVLAVSSRERLDQLIAALQAVIDRHDILRTAVLWDDLPQPIQVVYRRAVLPVQEISLDPLRDPLEQLTERIRPERQRLDIREAPLLRLQIAADPNDAQWYVILQLHHMTTDHVTVESVTSEIVAHLEGRAQPLSQSIPYRNHVARALAYARAHNAEAFFRGKLGDIEEPTAPFGLMDVLGDGSQIEEASQRLETELAKSVRARARRLGVSAATLFHSAWALVVAHTSARDDVVFGTVLLGRMNGGADAQQMLGMFINTLPLRLRLKGVTAKELVEQTQRELVGLLSHEQASLAEAQRCSGIVGSAPLFTTLLNYRHSVPNPHAQWSSARDVRVLAGQERTNYPLTMSVDDLGEGFVLTAKTLRGIDPNRLIGYLRTAVRSLAETLERGPQRSALELAVVPDSEHREVVATFNATEAEYPQERLLHQLFEEQVMRTPDAVAVMSEGQWVTYAELNGRANQLARHLSRRGVGPDQLVALCVERSLEMMVALLATWKAGGAYVPLDPDYPVSRLRYMLKDASPRVLLIQQKYRGRVSGEHGELVVIDKDWKEISKHGATNLDLHAADLHSRWLAYVIYTSGSTGRPKGVMIEHRNVTSLWQGLERVYRQVPGCQRVGVNASFNFDASVKQLVQLLSGRTIVLVPQEVRWDAQAMLAFIDDNRIDGIDCTPAQLKTWISAGLLEPGQCRLRMALVGGEPIDAQLWADLAACRGVDFYNVYGPTESTVDATVARLRDDSTQPHIGRPMENRHIYVLDSHGRTAPIGVAGEICIGGAGVARGYLNQPELTAQRFIGNSFAADPQTRIYKTGDLGRWRVDGVVEYLGRNDHQVKIRGIRIELGEIEAQLMSHEQVKDAAVIAREDVPGDKRLVAYVVPMPGSAATADTLRLHLKAALPQHMVPSAYVVLERLPLTVNGKLDRRALPVPQFESYASRQYEAPSGEIEQALAGIWQELLGVERIGIHDNIFDLGGHSLLVLRALVKIKQQFPLTLRVTDVYGSPTIGDLAARIRGVAAQDGVLDLAKEAMLDAEIVASSGPRCARAEAILLTGATGFVGRFLLTQLLHGSDATIYCLVRASSKHEASTRLQLALTKWDLWRDDFERRVIAFPGDLRLPRLGLDDGTYAMLCRNVDTIFHCATSMNHLETYAMAKPANVDAAKEILKLATQLRSKVINYISTLSVFRPSAANPARVINEDSPIDQEVHYNSNGYAASKWVAEKLFLTASQRGIPCNIFRLGLVWADSRQGRYDELQRVYRIIKSSLLSGCGIEGYRTDMAPTPVDHVARAIAFLANRYRDGQGIFHLGASRQAVDGFFERCNEAVGTSLKLLPYYEWICEMKRLHRLGHSLPAVPLIEFAFAMDEKAFRDWWRAGRAAGVHFDLNRTHVELEQAGIVAPVLDDELLKLSVESMLARDIDLRELTKRDGRVAAASSMDRPRLNG